MVKKTEAKYWKLDKNNHIQCLLCPNKCILTNQQRGICRTRLNDNSTLFTESYGNICSSNIDPIEKKPLYHFYPYTSIYSVGCNSCNLNCQFCQNYEISQHEVPVLYLSPEKIVDLVIKNNCQAIAFTYTEPLMMAEYLLDCLPLLKEHSIKTVLVSNAYINEQPLLDLLPFIDAWNVDLKSFSKDFYKDLCSAEIDIVKNNIKIIANNTHIEISFLVIPTLNDSHLEIDAISSFIASINPNIPLHINRYHPSYKINIPPTPLETLIKFYEIASEKLHYVYIGNIGNTLFNQTKCPKCGKVLLDRNDSTHSNSLIINNQCSNCGSHIYGKF
ncbi:MAG TPA: AmmeMemoRadiSam system radical SAM enzyme [Candidatus Cloacimonadota bacterium]|nr:AmmeMemoRadiSam system radical SAM enzyme [Candidatus Cloacimonadota bacterium]